MEILNQVFPSCKDLAERLARGEYDRAPAHVRLGVRWHLYRCELCEKYAEQLKAIGQAFASGLQGKAAADAERLKKDLLAKLERR